MGKHQQHHATDNTPLCLQLPLVAPHT